MSKVCKGFAYFLVSLILFTSVKTLAQPEVEFLPVADACERALKMLDDDQNAPDSLQQYQQGVELLYRQVLDALNRTGAEAMDTEGKPFDPHQHEALSREETLDFDEGTITKELRRGYLLKEKLLRPAQVVVAVRPQGKD